jgi:glycosyltransferase involved in cell wall biosynthesis
MDIKTLLNRAKTRIRYWLISDLWIKKLVPAKIRHLFSNQVIDALATHTDVPAPYIPGKYPKGINLYGFFKAENGLAQGVKMYARALEESNIPHTLLNTDFLDWLPQNDTTFDDRLTTENKYAVNVIHINPDQWEEACGMFPRDQFNGHYNIGVWLWELEQIPDRWIPIIDYVDEVWTPSEFIAGAMRKATDKPVTVIPYGMETPYDETLTRADFGLSDDDFLVLTMYDSNSYASRKNPGAAIDAFREAYGDNPEKVKLVIKISNPKPEDLEFVEKKLVPGSYILMTERLERKQLNSLIRLCDVFISMHRAEGFGLVMAEAMMLGTPAVATGWSANTEFMPEDVSCPVKYTLIPVAGGYQFDNGELLWADPDVHHAAEYLKRLRDDPEYYRQKAEAGKRYIEENLSLEHCADVMRRRMEEILAGKAEEGT